MEQYRMQCELILEKLELQDLLHKELERINRFGSLYMEGGINVEIRIGSDNAHVCYDKQCHVIHPNNHAVVGNSLKAI